MKVGNTGKKGCDRKNGRKRAFARLRICSNCRHLLISGLELGGITNAEDEDFGLRPRFGTLEKDALTR